jgi:hypothetical protein
MCAEIRQVVLDGAQVVAIFFRLELAPGVLDLRALERRGLKERAIGNPLAIAFEEDLVGWLSGGDTGSDSGSDTVGAAARLLLRFAPLRRDDNGSREQQEWKAAPARLVTTVAVTHPSATAVSVARDARPGSVSRPPPDSRVVPTIVFVARSRTTNGSM